MSDRLHKRDSPVESSQPTVEHYARYAWVVVAMSALFLFYKYILQVSPSVMTDDLMRQFHVTGAGLGNLAATYFYTFLVVQIAAGPLLDRYSPRLLTTAAIFLCAIGMYGFSHSNTLLSAQIFRSLIGVGAAFATVSYLKLAANWFPGKQYAFVAGLLATAVGIGAVVGETPLALMVDKIGWRDTLTVCAWLGVGVAALYFIFVRNTPRTGPIGQDETEVLSQGTSWRAMLGVITNGRNWLLTFYSGLAFSPLAVFGGLWGAPFLQEAHHLTKAQAAEFITLLFVGLGLGAPLFGWISDRLGKRLAVMSSGTLLSLFAVLVVIYYPGHSPWIVGISLFLFGIGTGSFMLGFAIGKEINSLMLAGTVIAMINTGDALFGSVTEPLIGKILDMFWGGQIQHGVHYFPVQDYYRAFIILPIYLVVSLGFAALLAFYSRDKQSV